MRLFVLFVILLVSSWLTLGISSVYAQEPTPSETWQPLFPSPTARPTINDICPDYQPIGWQTVTPSSRWIMNCSQCIVQPTADWSNIEYTPFPEEYVSHLGYCTEEEETNGCYNDNVSGGIGCICLGYPTATPTLSGYNPYPSGTPTQQINPNYYVNTSYYTNTQSHSYVDQAGLVTKYFNVPWTVINQCPGGTFLGYWQKIVYNYDYINGDNSFSSEYGVLAYGDSSSTKGSCNLKSDFLTIPGLGTISNVDICNNITSRGLNPAPQTFRNPAQLGGWVKADYKTTFNATINSYPVCYGTSPTATPYPTPQYTPTIDTGSDYCNEVEEKPENLADEIGLELPIPSFGEGTCIVIGGWSIDLTWLESIFPNLFTFGMPDSLGVPGFNLCLHPFTFGYMNLFGILLDMDVMFLLVSYIMVVRWLLRS
ncbi:MAG: hypothetical protein IH595_14850 [Bacteroidales bacterium]|nr:hypothetical protein [Bacteroidales bacterium]